MQEHSGVPGLSPDDNSTTLCMIHSKKLVTKKKKKRVGGWGGGGTTTTTEAHMRNTTPLLHQSCSTLYSFTQDQRTASKVVDFKK